MPDFQSRTHYRIASSAALARLIIVSATLQAQVSPPNIPPPNTTTTPSASTRPLSIARLDKIVGDIEERNQRVNLPLGLTNALGLANKGEALSARYRAVKDTQGIYHALFLLDGTAWYLFSGRNGERIRTWYVDRSLNIVSVVDNPAVQPTAYVIVPPPEATKTLESELLWWADKADHLTDK